MMVSPIPRQTLKRRRLQKVPREAALISRWSQTSRQPNRVSVVLFSSIKLKKDLAS